MSSQLCDEQMLQNGLKLFLAHLCSCVVTLPLFFCSTIALWQTQTREQQGCWKSACACLRSINKTCSHISACFHQGGSGLLITDATASHLPGTPCLFLPALLRSCVINEEGHPFFVVCVSWRRLLLSTPVCQLFIHNMLLSPSAKAELDWFSAMLLGSEKAKEACPQHAHYVRDGKTVNLILFFTVWSQRPVA